MRKLALCIGICCLYFSCKKLIQDVVVINPSSTTIDLKIDQVINDSTIVLKWSKYTGTNFQKYRLVRSSTYLKNGKFETYTDPVDSSHDVNHLSFNENSMPLAVDIFYDLYISTDTTKFNQGLQRVAHAYYKRPNSLLYGNINDVFIDTVKKWLYVTDDNSVSIVNYTTSRIIASKQFPVTISFCSLGDYNGTKELYVPENDGWLLILDPVTLQLKDKIYAAGYGMGSVLAVNNKLYVSSSDLTLGYTNCIKVFDRATKTLISRAGYWDQTRLVQLQGSSVEMIDITTHLIPSDLSYYQFNTDGVLITEKEDTYHGDYPMSANIVKSFPDGTKFITSSSGTIFNKSLVFDRYVKEYGNYSDFAFNTDGSLIYAADPLNNKIDVVTYPSTTNISSYTTSFSPFKIFRDGNALICVSKVAPSTGYIQNYLVFEKINL